MSDDPVRAERPALRPSRDRRTTGPGRRAYWRGGRRAGDWPASLEAEPRCPRCHTPEVRLVEATPETLFWSCRACRYEWESDRAGTPRLI